MAEISLPLVEFAGLAHDLGHPPFGHIGERELNSIMRNAGGFEGNAQTLRLLSKLEKKVPDFGLDCTYRSLASVIKYDRLLPMQSENGEPELEEEAGDEDLLKGYYQEEEDLVEAIKTNVGWTREDGGFRTLECDIMDYADDIAYSTYDVEDALKSGLATLDSFWSQPDEFYESVVRYAKRALANKGFEPNYLQSLDVSTSREVLFSHLTEDVAKLLREWDPESTLSDADASLWHRALRQVASDGLVRTRMSTRMVKEYVHNVNTRAQKFAWNATFSVDQHLLALLQVFKRTTFELLVKHPRNRAIEYRGRRIIRTLFRAFWNDPRLLPSDHCQIVESCDTSQQRARAICDYIAGMTDRFAVDYFARLTSERPQPIWTRFS